MTLLPILNKRLHIFDDEIVKYEKKKLADRIAFNHSVEYYDYSENILCQLSDVRGKYQ